MWLFRSKPSQNICQTVAQTFHEEVDDEDEYFASSITLLSKPSTDGVVNKLDVLQDKINSMTTIYNILSEFKPTSNLLLHNRSAPNTLKHDTSPNTCEIKQQAKDESEKPLDTKEDNNIQTLSKYIDSMKQCIIQLSEEVTQVVNSHNDLNTKLSNICGEPCKPSQEHYHVTSLTHDKNSVIQPEHVITKDQSISTFSKTKAEKNSIKPKSKEELKNLAKLQSMESSKAVSSESRKKKLTNSKDITKGKVIKPGKNSQQIKTNSSFQEKPLTEHTLIEKNTSTTDLQEKNPNILVGNVARGESRLYFKGDCLFPNLNMVFKSIKTTNETSKSVNENSPFGVSDDVYCDGSTKNSANNGINCYKNLDALRFKEIEKPKETRLESNLTKCAELCKALKTETLPESELNMGSKKTDLTENHCNINIQNSKIAKGLSFMEKCDIALNTNGYQIVNEMVLEKTQNTGHHNELSPQHCHGNLSSCTVDTDNNNKFNDFQNNFEQNMTLNKCFNKGNRTDGTNEKKCQHSALRENKKASCNQNGICKFLQSQPVPDWIVQTKLLPNSKDSSNKAHEKTAAFSCNNVCQMLPSSDRTNNTKCPNKNNVLDTNSEDKQSNFFNSTCHNNSICQLLHSQPAPEWTKSTSGLNKNEDFHKCDVNNQGIKYPNNSQNKYKKDDHNPVGSLNSPCKKNGICQFLQSQPVPEWTKSTKCPKEIKHLDKKDDHNPGESLNSPCKKNEICQFLQSQPVPEWTKSTKCPNEIKHLDKKYNYKQGESSNCPNKKNGICQFLHSQSAPEWTKSTSGQNKNKDLHICDDENQENISKCPNNNQNILKKNDHNPVGSLNSPCKKNGICQFLQSQPAPEWTKSTCTNETKNLHKKYDNKPGESLNCSNKKTGICGSVQSKSTCITNIEGQPAEEKNNKLSIAEVKLPNNSPCSQKNPMSNQPTYSPCSANTNGDAQIGSRDYPCDKCKALYIKQNTDSQNKKLTNSKPQFNKALEDEILQCLNGNPCNKRCPILVSGPDSLLNTISLPVISKQDTNTLEDEHKTTRKCPFSQQDVDATLKDVSKPEQDSLCTKILSPCGTCNHKKATNCEAERVKENENVAQESSKSTKKCPCSSQKSDSYDPPNNGKDSSTEKILSPCGTCNHRKSTNCEPEQVKENENVAQESSKPTKKCPCSSQRSDSCNPQNSEKDSSDTKILSPCGKCTAKPVTSYTESSCQQTRQPKNIAPGVGFSSCDSTVARPRPDKTKQNNDPKENAQALSPCAFNATTPQTENQPSSQTQCNSKCPQPS